MKLPQNVAFLERYIRRMFKTELDAYRMRVSMANVVLAQMLPASLSLRLVRSPYQIPHGR